mmetsp:Transcript_18763/g.53402  ORF Transcript_18763/g.53402 Transcript_18763/m.53402 type:complete len:110 (-) Transcript_18763:115-444(-)
MCGKKWFLDDMACTREDKASNIDELAFLFDQFLRVLISPEHYYPLRELLIILRPAARWHRTRMAVFFFELGQQFISTKQQRGFFLFLLLLIKKGDGLEEDGLGGGRSHP